MRTEEPEGLKQDPVTSILQSYFHGMDINVNILDRFGSPLYNSSFWVNPSQCASLPLSYSQ
jgi:hypothetical protein